MQNTKTSGQDLKISVFDYQDYREYLKDFLEWKRSTLPSYSVRQFCLKAKVSTDNYLLRIIRGQRNLGPDMAKRFTKALGLTPPESKYFLTLVEFQNAKLPSEQAEKYQDLEKLLKTSKAANTEMLVDNSLFTHWHIAVIWELASCQNVKMDPQSIVRALKGKISVQQAKEALDLLLKQNLLEFDAHQNRYLQKPVFLKTTGGVRSAIVQLNHRQMLERAEEALNLPLDERGFYGITIALQQKNIPQLKKKILEWIQQIRAENADDSQADSVYRLNVQCFPLAKVPEES